MGVYIKDFEMPKCCAECHLSDVYNYPPDYDDEWTCGITYHIMSYEDAQMRYADCPLTEEVGGVWNWKGNYEDIKTTNFDMWECTACGEWISVISDDDYFKKHYKYCPNCGAKMENE